jgi:chemotaxis protein histidine kinase CheA
VNKYTLLFLDESREYLQTLLLETGRLRRGEHSPEQLDDCSRLAHSIKGMAKFEGQDHVATLARALEKAYARVAARDGDHRPAADAIGRGLDLLDRHLGEIREGGVALTDPAPLVTDLDRIMAD